MSKPPKLGQAQRGVIAALLCLALVIGVFDGLSSQRPSAQPNSAAKAGNPAEQQKQEEGWLRRATDPLTIITFLLVVVGAGQLGLFWRQLALIRESLDDAKQAADAAKEAAVAARANAETAKEQVAVMRMGVIDLERAYLAIGPTEISVDYVLNDAVVRGRGYYMAGDPEEVIVQLRIQYRQDRRNNQKSLRVVDRSSAYR